MAVGLSSGKNLFSAVGARRHSAGKEKVRSFKCRRFVVTAFQEGVPHAEVLPILSANGDGSGIHPVIWAEFDRLASFSCIRKNGARRSGRPTPRIWGSRFPVQQPLIDGAWLPISTSNA